MHFGATLRLLRLQSGLSLRDLARRLGVSGAYLSRVENGLDSAPTPARLEAMARELGVPPTLLMELAHRVSPLVVDYVDRVPEAGSLFLEIAHSRLTATELAELREIVNERFPRPRAEERAALPSLAELLSPERLVLQLTCSGMEDILDVAASRLIEAVPGTTAPALAATLARKESEVSSAIGGGVAVPAVCVPDASPAAALVTLGSPFPYDTPDGEPLRLVIVLIGAAGTDDHLLRLAQIARLAARGLAETLGPCSSPSKALAQLAACEVWP
jgi:PTS system nitrogen regulatory IIA component